MESTDKAADRKGTMNPEEKWIRLQEIGLSQFLAFPVALILGVMFRLSSALLILITLALMVGGYCCFRRGHEKRREIHDQEDKEVNNENNGSKN